MKFRKILGAIMLLVLVIIGLAIWGNAPSPVTDILFLILGALILVGLGSECRELIKRYRK